MAQQVDSTSHQLATRIPAGLHRAVKIAAFMGEVTLREWVADALAEHLARLQGPKRGTAANENAPRVAPVTDPRHA